jgi:signal transduction histidine kinase
MKKALPLTLILLGAALLITAVVFWIDSSNSAEPQSFGQALRDWITLILGLGASLKGWLDFAKKETPPNPAQSNTDGGIMISGTVDSVGRDMIGRDQYVTTNLIAEESAYNVEGLPNPYLGLQAFTYNERDRYAGREKLTDEALQRLVSPENQSNLLFVTGASGSGKSSFAQAGLLPALVSYYEAKGYRVRHAVFKPSRNPRARLGDAIVQLGPKELQVIIIDQFEELFTQSRPDQCNEFAQYLSTLPPFRESRRFFIATLRSDYLGEMHDNMEALWEIAKSGVPLRGMRPQEIKDAIQRPLQVRFPNGAKRFEARLVDKLAEDTKEITYLPLLQVTLEALWNKGELKLSAYNTLTDAIKERADTVWTYHDFDHAHPNQNRSREDQDEMIDLLLDLVNVSMDDDTKRDVRVSRPLSDFTEKQRALLHDLTKARLISINTEDGKEIVGLIHETLIRNWDILRDNITAKRIQLQRRVRFETQLGLWLSSNRADDYLLSKGQIAEARELENSGDIAVGAKAAQDFLNKSIVRIDAYEKRERMFLLAARKIKELSAPMADEERFRKILDDAVSIFDCEAGTLYLIDERTSDLIFHVTVGPAAESLRGLRLPAGTGIAGRAVEIHEAVMENDVQQSTRHSKKGDQLTGFVSRSILAVPLRVGDRMIGVLEIINRRDGLPFFEEDEAVLTVYAGQAVTYIERARLPALTDPSLAKQVEDEQRINEMERTYLANSEFVSFVAHELKNPMTSIKGYTELLAAGSVGQINEMQTNFLNTIRANIERMSALVSDLNDNAKIDAGQLRLDYKRVDLPEVADEVVRSLSRQTEDKHQTVELRLPEPLRLAWADRVRVAQILTDLISNAHKYAPEGGRIVVGAEVVPNEWDPDGAREVIHFWVKDSGIGIRREDHDKIFQKFFRSDDSKAREVPGTGLGLYITKRLVEMMGGRIWFESEFRKGSTFHFTVPVAEG